MNSKAVLCETIHVPGRVDSNGKELASTIRPLISGTLWSLIGSLMARGITLLAAILVGRMLGVYRFGELGIIQNTAGMFGIFAGLGLGVTATRHIAAYSQSDREKTGRIISLCHSLALGAGFICAVGIALAAPWLAKQTLAAAHLSGALQLGSGLVLLGAITGVQAGILSGFEAFKVQARVNIVAAFCTAPLVLLGVYWAGVRGGVCGLTVGLLVTALMNYSAIKTLATEHEIPITFCGAKNELGNLGRFSFYAFLGSIMGVPINWLCNSILVNQPGGYEQMGIFNAANQWRMIILFLPATVGSVLLPIMTRLYGQGDHSRYRHMWHLSILMNAGVALTVALPLIVFSRPVLEVYGPAFASGQSAFVLLLLGAVLIAINNGLSRAIVSSGEIRIDLIFHVVWGSIFLFSAWFLIPRLALTGLALATICGAMIQGVCQAAWLLNHSRNHSPAK